MTVTQIRPAARPHTEPTEESARVAELQQMIRSGKYGGYLAELKDELAKAKAARAEIVAMAATSVLAA